MDAEARRLAESGELSRMLIEVAERAKADFATAAQGLDLPVPLARALLLLDEPLSMRQLAARLGYDPSYITGIADQLESRGLIDRVRGRDRRITLLAPSEPGRALRQELADAVARRAAVAHRLGPDERAALRGILAQLLALQAEQDPA